MKKSGVAAIATAAVLLVGGGTAYALTTNGQDPTPVETTTASTPTPDAGESEQPSASPLPTSTPLVAETPKTADADALFLTEARTRLAGLGTATTIPNATDDQLVTAGREACADMADGTVFSDVTVIEGEPRTQGSYLDSAAIASAGILFYCPELNGKVGR